MTGLKNLSVIKRKLREHFQGNPKVKAWVSRKLEECKSNGAEIPDTVRLIQEFSEGEPLDGGKHWRTRTTAHGKKVMNELLLLQKSLEAEMAKPTSRRTASATVMKTRKRITVSN